LTAVEGSHDEQHQEEEGKEEGFPGPQFLEPSIQAVQLSSVQKPKLKVGKAKPKAANFTDTSFKAKCV
jgi:hypothetical protein